MMDGRKKVKCKNVFAGGYWSAFLSMEDKLFVCGLNNFGQLGFPAEEGGLESFTQCNNTFSEELRIVTPKISDQLSGKNWTHIEGVQHLVLRAYDGFL